MNKYLRLVIAMAVVLGGMAFLLRHDPMMPTIIAGVVFMTAAIFGIFASPRAIKFINDRPKFIISLGFFFIIAPVLLMLAVVLVFPSVKLDDGLMTDVLLASIMIGSLLVTLPRSAKRAAQLKSTTTTARSSGSEAGVSIPGVVDAIQSILFVFRNRAAFLRIAGPWAAANALLPLVALQAIALHDGITQSFLQPVAKTDNATVVIAYLVSVLVFAIGFSTVSVAWHRYVLKNRFPRTIVALPDRRVLRHMYRIWIFGIAMGAIEKMLRANATDLSKQLGAATASIAIQAAGYLIWLLAIWLASGFALVLPAIAVDDHEMTGQLSVTDTRPWGMSYRFGALLAPLPFLIGAIALQKYFQVQFGSALTIQQLLALVPSLSVFAGVTAFATFLSRAYLAARAQSNTPPSAPSPILT